MDSHRCEVDEIRECNQPTPLTEDICTFNKMVAGSETVHQRVGWEVVDWAGEEEGIGLLEESSHSDLYAGCLNTTSVVDTENLSPVLSSLTNCFPFDIIAQDKLKNSPFLLSCVEDSSDPLPSVPSSVRLSYPLTFSILNHQPQDVTSNIDPRILNHPSSSQEGRAPDHVRCQVSQVEPSKRSKDIFFMFFSELLWACCLIFFCLLSTVFVVVSSV